MFVRPTPTPLHFNDYRRRTGETRSKERDILKVSIMSFITEWFRSTFGLVKVPEHSDSVEALHLRRRGSDCYCDENERRRRQHHRGGGGGHQRHTIEEKVSVSQIIPSRQWGTHVIRKYGRDKMAGKGGGDEVKFGVNIPDEIEKGDLMAATSHLQQLANDYRAQRVNWQPYLHSQMISQEDYNFIVAFDTASGKSKEQMLGEQSQQCAKTFLNLMSHVSKNQTIYYVLVLIDDMFQENRTRVEIFKEYARKKKESAWAPFINMLNNTDGFITNMVSRLLAKMACWSTDLMDGSDLHFYLSWLKDQLKLPENEYIQSVGRCLQMMLRIDEYRFAFVAVDGISTLVSVLSGRHNFQIQYQLTFCIWVLTFNPILAEKMNKFNIIPILADILSDNVKEKVIRIVVAVLRNLIEKPEDVQICKDHCIAMVQARVLKHLDLLSQRKFEDEDIEADIKYLADKLNESVQDLSSFDEYASEIKSGRLEWSPVHKSTKFWRENAPKLCDKNYELLKILINLLQTCKDPQILSVACYDIGEFVHHYSVRGKTVIEQLGGKQVVMALLTHEDSSVKYEALLCVQKFMVHNWEYLGKQLEKETKAPAPNKAVA